MAVLGVDMLCLWSIYDGMFQIHIQGREIRYE